MVHTSSPGAFFNSPRYNVQRVGTLCAASRKNGTRGVVRLSELKRSPSLCFSITHRPQPTPPNFQHCTPQDVARIHSLFLGGADVRWSRTRLTEGSDLFKDMLGAPAEEKYPVIAMAEPPETLRALSDIIHDPPKMLAPPAARPKFKPGAPDILPPE